MSINFRLISFRFGHHISHEFTTQSVAISRSPCTYVAYTANQRSGAPLLSSPKHMQIGQSCTLMSSGDGDLDYGRVECTASSRKMRWSAVVRQEDDRGGGVRWRPPVGGGHPWENVNMRRAFSDLDCKSMGFNTRTSQSLDARRSSVCAMHASCFCMVVGPPLESAD